MDDMICKHTARRHVRGDLERATNLQKQKRGRTESPATPKTAGMPGRLENSVPPGRGWRMGARYTAAALRNP